MREQQPTTRDIKLFMAHQGLIRWVEAVIQQRRRVDHAHSSLMKMAGGLISPVRDSAQFAFHTDVDFFCIAAHQIINYRQWAVGLGLFLEIDFTALDAFDAAAIRDLRNMREHAIDYFNEEGRAQKRWMKDTPEYSADATATRATMIGGRLDWAAFGDMAEGLLPHLRRSTIPM